MAAQQQGGGQQDTSLTPLWVVSGLFLAAVILWYVEHTLLVRIFFAIKLAEIDLIGLFTSKLLPVKNFIENADPSQITLYQLVTLSRMVGQELAIPIAILFLLMAFILYKNNTARSFRKNYSMHELAEQEQQNWPYITPVLGADLIKKSLDEGPWAMAMTPMMFAKKYKLLREIKQERDVKQMVLQRHLRPQVKLLSDRANQVFRKQLGVPWEGVEFLPIYMQALFVIFAAKAEGDRDFAREMLRQIAGSAKVYPFTVETLNFSGVPAAVKKYQKSKLIQKVVSRHAYVLTVMASMLDLARSDGVVPSAEFVWLKPIDRRLWFVLNTVGRQTAPTEVAGVMAHWLAECALADKILVPMVEEATNALQAALDELIYSPDEG